MLNVMNHAERYWILPTLLVVLSIGPLYGWLAALYAPPAAGLTAPAQTQMEADLDAGPSSFPQRREDAELFDRALVAGLLQSDGKGRIVVAPADLPLRWIYARGHPDFLTPRGDEPDWLSGPWNDEIRRLHQALHFSASGRYVRQQIEAFNARRPGFARIQWRDGHLVWRDRS